MRTSLASRVRWLVAALCLGFGIVALGAFSALSQRQVSEAVARDADSTSQSLAAMIEGRGKLLAALTKFIATRPHVRDLALTDAPTATEAADEMRAESGVDAIALVDRDGRMLGFSGRGAGAQDVALRSALSGTPWRGVVARGGELMLAASEPLRIGSYVQGALSAYQRLDGGTAQEIGASGSLQVAFVLDGAVAGDSSAGSGLRVRTDSRPWRASVGGTGYAARYLPLPGTAPADRMGFVVLRRLDALLGPIRQFEIAFGTVLVLLCVAMMFAGSSMGVGLVRSLDGLVASARALQRGERPDPGPATRTDEVGVLQDAFNEMASSIRASEARLMAMTDMDPLTELDNHRRFKERLGYEAARARQEGGGLTMVLFDVDRFAEFNDRNGPAEGDRLLGRVADALRQAAPELAVLARYGGDEFVALLPGDPEGAARLFEAVGAGVAEIGLSGGCAAFGVGGDGTAGLVVGAELALAQAKHSGRGMLCTFDPSRVSGLEDPSRVYGYLEEGTFATISALAAAVDAKDAYTHGHSERVAQYAAELAAYMGERPEEIDVIRRAGALHDVGKIGVPDAVLQKPGRLTAEEFRAMQAHPALGELIVSKVPQLRELLPGIRHHHERYDGKGYPDGLAGEAIPRMARFLAIADTFDAMTSDRPYRAGLDRELALDEIEAGAGAQFDPELARGFAQMRRAESTRRAA